MHASLADSIAGLLEVSIAGQAFALLPDRAAFHFASASLLLADVHLGKSVAFARGGLPMDPSTVQGIMQRDLDRITTLIQQCQARQLIIVGDLFHSRSGCDATTLSLLAHWRSIHHALPITLIRGNHDRASGDPPPHLSITCLSNGATLNALTLHHEPLSRAALTTRASDQGPIIAGHLHPVISLSGMARQKLRCACFWIQDDKQLILPAFGTFTGGYEVSISTGDQLCAIIAQAPGKVMDVTSLAGGSPRKSLRLRST
jgi:uncharacterized protein